jgi:hypothetical protein
MKLGTLIMLSCLLTGRAVAEIRIDDINLNGRISAEALNLHMEFEAEVEKAPARLKVLEGAVLPTGIELPRGAQMVMDEGGYSIEFSRKGRQAVALAFQVKVESDGRLRSASFGLPTATLRRMELEADEEGYQVEVAGAPRATRVDELRECIYLPSAGPVEIQWRPRIEKLSGELVATCESMLVGSAKVGAFRLRGRYHYSIPQGRLRELRLKIPPSLNIIQVTGEDLLAWDVEEEAGDRMLRVELSRLHEKEYLLSVQAELALPEFPCSFTFPVVEPQDVIRANGTVLVGTDSAIKVLTDSLAGVTQVEPDAVDWGELEKPRRSLYAYTFAGMPFRISLAADNIVTALHAQDQLVLALSENEASLDARVDLEVRDAPARDVEMEVPGDWTVTSVSGSNVADYDVREREGVRSIKVYFKEAVDTRTLIQVRLEKNLPDINAGFRMPFFRLPAARSERGFLVLRGETGMRLEGTGLSGLREVNTGSLPVKIPDARQAFRFKRPGWSGRVDVRQESSSVHVESFQLVSLGESGVFGSSLITYNIANAPIRSFVLRIPAEYRNIEIHGRDIRNWTQDENRWTIHLTQKVIGDYTLLITYDHPAQYRGEAFTIGGIHTLNTENETGYLALAGSANLSLEKILEGSPSLLPIDVEEVPGEYALLVNDPIMHAFKYVAAPHEAKVLVKRFSTQPLLTQVVDHTRLETTVSKDGEAVTVAVYHVKNTDQQYLPLGLPEGARLWAVKVNGRKVQVLDEGGGQVLVPVERRRNPNAPQKIEITYAENLNRTGLFSRLSFRSPELKSQSVFAHWAFTLPDGQYVFSAGGNMEPPRVLARRRAGWGGFIAAFSPGTAVYWLGACAVLCLGLFYAGRSIGCGRSFSFITFISLLGGLIGAVAAAALLIPMCVGLAGMQSPLPGEWVFSKAVSGFDGGLEVQLSAAGAGFERIRIFLLLAAGLIPAAWMIAAKKTRRIIPLLILVAVIYSFSPYLAWLTVVLPHMLLFYAAYAAGHSRGILRLKMEQARQELSSEPVHAEGREGFIRPGLLIALMILMTAAAGCATSLRPCDDSGSEPDPRPLNTVQAGMVRLQVAVPEFEGRTRVNVAVEMEVELDARKGDTFHLLGPGCILTEYSLPSRHLSLSANPAGTLLHVGRDGTYRISVGCLMMAESGADDWSMPLWLPESLRNSTTVHLPAGGWNLLSDESIHIKQSGAVADILFDSAARRCTVRWRPEERKTDQEQSRFYCDVNTLVDFRQGMAGLNHDIRFNIAQGELQNLRFDVPSGMSITEVRGVGISTWRYDAASGLLEVMLSAPVAEAYQMEIGAQVAREKLPYEAVIEGLAVDSAVVQRGVVAFASSDAVQIDIASVSGLSGINIEDAALLLKRPGETSLKRAYRYNRVPFTVRVAAEQVLPELRLSEQTSLDVATEQVRLSSRLNVTVSKSGIFSLRIGIPEGFDVDSLTGDAVSHWDEVTAGDRELLVHFTRQILGPVSLNLLLSRSGRDLEAAFTMPRIKVDGVLKHTGSMVVTAERGVRLTPSVRDGVSEISPRELGVRQNGSLAYRLLRPDWRIELRSEVMAPKVKAEVLQKVALSEGLLKVHCYLQYDIEHAGVKTFRLKPPQPDLALVVSGRDISRVRKVDEEAGIWEVELHGRVEHRYGMEVTYQLPFAHDRSELTIHPLLTLGTESQKGYVTVLSGGRLQIKPESVSEFLRPEDARSIPRRFGAADLSDAVLCYRSTERDYRLLLGIVRHDAADVLPAQVTSVRIDSVVTTDHQALHSMAIDLEPGSLRFLEIRFPEDVQIWSVFVNETAVHPLVEDGIYLVPIEAGADLTAAVEVVYAQTADRALFSSRQRYSGPQFKLPLKNVHWTFYAPAGYHYGRFDGTMQLVGISPLQPGADMIFDETQYYSFNSDNSQRFGDNAKQNILRGNALMESGDQRNARRAFQKAISYSQGQQALNEDARVQFRNLVRQQGVVGLVNRRNQLKQSLNQLDTVAAAASAEGWSEADVLQIQAELGEKESSALSSLAERMLEQQQAASTEVHPIRAAMIRQGTRIELQRRLQLQTDAAMQVEFRSARISGSRVRHAAAVVLAAGIIFLAGRILAGSRRLS